MKQFLNRGTHPALGHQVRKNPKPYQGLKPGIVVNPPYDIEDVGKTLKPYQGLKLPIEFPVEDFADSQENPKTLSGIETGCYK